jgi:hypothetical protein
MLSLIGSGESIHCEAILRENQTRGRQVLVSSIKGEVKKKHFSCGRNFSCFAAHWIELAVS